MKEKVVERILGETKETFLEGVDSSIHEKILLAYKNYLMETYANILREDDNLEQVIRIWSHMEKRKWVGKNTSYKLSMIIKDDNLDKLREISGIGYKLAQKKMGFVLSDTQYTPELSKEQMNAYIEEMQNLFEHVEPFNINIARNYLSEGILDFQFAMNLSEDKSLRTCRMK